MKIVVDAMGGDFAPRAPVLGTFRFATEHPDINFTLVGHEGQIRAVNPDIPKNIEIQHTESVIAADDEPVRAVRRKRDSSLVTAAKMVHDEEADVMISAGNTGALVAAGLLVIGRLEGIERPALAPVLPTFDGGGVLLLDAGATMDTSSTNLLQFAHMGSAYSRYVLGVTNPRVGLLNVGTEEGKGNGLTKETYPLLKASGLNFVGNIEARELLNGSCDVAVCDGFAGNVILKLVEGVGLGIFGALKESLTATTASKLAAAVLKPSLRKFRDRFDYAEYGGAPFLGVNGGCIKAHGSSNERAWYTALRQAVRFAEEGLLEKMSASLHQA